MWKSCECVRCFVFVHVHLTFDESLAPYWSSMNQKWSQKDTEGAQAGHSDDQPDMLGCWQYCGIVDMTYKKSKAAADLLFDNQTNITSTPIQSHNDPLFVFFW